MAERSLNGNDIGVWYKEQTTKGTVPATPDFTQIRRTGGHVDEAIAFVQSEEVKTNRQGKMNIVDTNDIAFELSAETTEQTILFLQAALQNTENVATVTASTISSDADGFNGSGGSEFADFESGDYIFVSGFTNTDLNRTYKITAKAGDGDITTSPAPVAVVAAGDSVTIDCNKTVSGSSQRYFLLQNRVVDKSQVGEIAYQSYYDQQVGGMTVEIGESGIIGNTVNFAGDSESKVAGLASISGQTDNAADSSDVLSATNNVVTFWVDSATENCVIKSLSLEISNNLQDDAAAGCGTERVNGDFTATASIVARNRIDDSLRWDTLYKNSTTIQTAVELDHGSGKYTVIEIGKGRITEHTYPDGANTVANSEITVAAEEDSRGITVAIYRNW